LGICWLLFVIALTHRAIRLPDTISPSGSNDTLKNNLFLVIYQFKQFSFLATLPERLKSRKYFFTYRDIVKSIIIFDLIPANKRNEIIL
jgi:hypothetical protein